MSTYLPELLEQRKDFMIGESKVQAGFKVLTDRPLAGGAVELQFFIELNGVNALYFAVSGDRMKRRPGQFVFTGIHEGYFLEDPISSDIYMGGPVGVVKITEDKPWHQTLLLNDFLKLEETKNQIVNGNSGLMNLMCRRNINLGRTETEALLEDKTDMLEVCLVFNLYRDDLALVDLINDIFDRIMSDSVADRQHSLDLLLSIRTPALAQIEALTRHEDPSVVSRARQAIVISSKQSSAEGVGKP